MQSAQSDDASLPPLREDLNISPGAPLLNGAPSWVIYDPVRHRFFQVGQRTIEMILNWSTGTALRLQADLKAKRALSVSVQEVKAVLSFLKTSDLLVESERGLAKNFAKRAAKQRGSLIKWILHRYIFFRVPLVRPNRFLQLTWPFVRPLFSLGFVVLTLIVFLFALYLASRQFSEILSHFRASFSVDGAITYTIALIFVKILHEMGHAYQAVARGLRVPVMGIAFIVMFPLLYTDTTDAWRLRKRYDRIIVDLGGIMVELTLAIYATLLWCFLPDGPARTAAFAVATISWIFSLLVNLNPLMRFDGYYLLADSLGVHNLQPRAFAMGKWVLREALFGLGDPPPEKHTRRMRSFLVIYGYATWIYRFFLFIAIALIVYHLFFKALGIILFLAEISFFIAAPVIREIKVWIEMRERIVQSVRTWITVAVLALLLAFLVFPISTRIQVPAVLDEERQQAIYSTVNGRLENVFVTEGQTVAAGDLLFSLENPELPLKIQQARLRIALNLARLQVGAGDTAERASRLLTERQLEQERETLDALLDQKSQMKIHAPHDGVLLDLATYLQPGTWFERKEFFARVIQPGSLTVHGFISEDALERLDRDISGHFIADDLRIPPITLEDPRIADFSVKSLPDKYLASTDGGDIPVSMDEQNRPRPDGVWYPIDAMVSAELSEDIPLLTSVQPGIIVLKSKPEALATRLFRRIARVLIREADL